MEIYHCKVESEKYPVIGNVFIREEKYYLSFAWKGKAYEEEIIEVKEQSSRFITILAVWKLDELCARIEMEEAYEAICAKKKRC